MNAVIPNWQDQYVNFSLKAAENLLQGFNPEISISNTHPQDETGQLPYFKATFRNPKTQVLHWVNGLEVMGSPRISRGTGVFNDDDYDQVIEGNFGRAIDLSDEIPTEEVLRQEAWNVIANFIAESGA